MCGTSAIISYGVRSNSPSPRDYQILYNRKYKHCDQREHIYCNVLLYARLFSYPQHLLVATLFLGPHCRVKQVAQMQL